MNAAVAFILNVESKSCNCGAAIHGHMNHNKNCPAPDAIDKAVKMQTFKELLSK